jgi:dienelactone hydrolase
MAASQIAVSKMLDRQNRPDNKIFRRPVTTATKVKPEAWEEQNVMKTHAMIGALATLVLFLGPASAAPVRHSEQLVEGASQGNHELDCTVIRPWTEASGPDDIRYPIIAWANGWDQGNVLGETTLEGYKPGLIEWALDGPYIVIAANQWSVQEGDLLQCIQWLVDRGDDQDSEYFDRVDDGRIGLAGHSQGGGAVIKAGNGEPNGFAIAALVAMTPYGPSWVDPGGQDGPMMLLGGTADTTTPVSSFVAVWDGVLEQESQSNGPGGLLAVVQGGSHNSDAWGVDAEGNTLPTEAAALFDFGRFQRVTELWWQIFLNDRSGKARDLKRALDTDPWITEATEDFGPTTRYCIPALAELDEGFLDDCLE